MEILDSFSGFSVDDLDAAKHFYGDMLGIECEDMMGGLSLKLPDGKAVWVYVKPDHQPAVYTILNLVVADIQQTVNSLKAGGIDFEMYDGLGQDDTGIAWGKRIDRGPNIAWFKDPAGNILAVIEQ